MSALLDFEFSAPAPRALEVATTLRMVMRIWNNTEALNSVQKFFETYKNWIRLSGDEIKNLPTLIRLRCAIAILWRLRTSRLDKIDEYINRHYRHKSWLDENGTEFLDCINQNSL